MASWVEDFVARAKGTAPPKPRAERLDRIRLNRLDLDLESYVYFVQAASTQAGPGPIKIGFSTNLTKRLTGLQTSSPIPLALLGTARGGAALEEKLHTILAASRTRGEWFHPTPHVATVIHDVLNSDLRVGDPVDPLPAFVARVTQVPEEAPRRPRTEGLGPSKPKA